MKTRSNMPLFVVETNNVKALSNSQIDLLRCGDYLVKKDKSGEHAYKVTFKSDTGMCITYHDAYCVETQSYDKVDGNWVYNSEDKTIIAEPSLENIKDAQGHNRFIEGSITGDLPTGLERLYGKWSLSGTHLMIVDVLSLANTTEIASGLNCGELELPEWVYNKIVGTIGTNGIEIKGFTAYDSSSQAQTFSSVLLQKVGNNKLRISKYSNLTLNSDKIVRLSFDLLIDNE